MFALGNESNYGLSWSSFEIENLPVGEQHEAKARFLYSLFNEAMAAGKAIDPNHPFTIVNGDNPVHRPHRRILQGHGLPRQ